MGAIGDQYPGEGWTIQNTEVTLCHGTGINVANGGKILGNKVHTNGQKGVGGGGDNILCDGNTISFNNYAGFDMGWEAGGSKFAQTRGLIVRNNHSFNNSGDGLWTDINNIDTLYEGNVLEWNAGHGISHEISYKAIFRSNIARFNGYSQDVWLWGSQLLIQNSQNVELYNNTVVVAPNYGNGIGLIYQNRGQGTYGPWITVNNSVHDNHIYHMKSPQGDSGAVADIDPNPINFWGSNLFDNNHYHVTNLLADHWEWEGKFQSWNSLRSLSDHPQEKHGTVDTNPPSF